MRFSINRTRIEKLLAQRNGYMVLAIGAIAICILQLMVMFFMVGREKIIFIPPTIDKSFWVSSEHVSPEYLSEMTLFFANLRFNITATNADMQRESLLKYTDPAYYNTLKMNLVQEADRITEEHVSMAFFPVNVKVDTKHFKAIIEGDLKSYVGDTALPTNRIRYLLTYRYDEGRLLVKSFEEVKHA